MDIKATLNTMTVAELRKVAARFHITGRSSMKKAELVRELSDPDIADVVELSVSLDETEEITADAETMSAIADAEAEYIEDGLKADADAGTYSFVNEVAFLVDAPGRAIATAAFAGTTVGATLIRERGRWTLSGNGRPVRARTLNKVAKLWAKQLGFHVDLIDVARMS